MTRINSVQNTLGKMAKAAGTLLAAGAMYAGAATHPSNADAAPINMVNAKAVAEEQAAPGIIPAHFHRGPDIFLFFGGPTVINRGWYPPPGYYPPPSYFGPPGPPGSTYYVPPPFGYGRVCIYYGIPICANN